MKSELVNLSVDSILFGQDHPGIAVNARKTDRDFRLEELVASIKAEGLLQPLLVWRVSERVVGESDYVVDGSRRLSAIRKILLDGGSPNVNSETVPALLIWDCTAEEALQKSIAGFSTTMPPHPVDQFEAFASIRAEHEADATEFVAKDIAQRYGITPGLVMRRLALGNLHEDIREAWRADVIGQKEAIAFTLLRDPERQLSIFTALKKKKALTEWSIRQEIVGDNRDIPKLLKLVTPEVFEQQGGEIYRDLFTEKEGVADGVSNPALLKDLARTVIENKKVALLDDGWAWAETIDGLPLNWSHTYTRMHLKKLKGIADKVKAETGCVISVTDDGKLEVEFGVMKPEEGRKSPAKKKAKASGDEDDTAPEPAEMKLPNKMVLALQRQATLAMAKAILDAPHDVCLAAIAASVAAGGAGGAGHSPIGITATGMTDRESGMSTDTADFGKTFANLRKKGSPALKGAIAQAASGAMDLVIGGEPLPFEDPGARALAATMPAKALNEALRKAFDHKAYFEGAGKPFLCAAITEALGVEAFEKVEKASKTELSKFCISHVTKTGWLPPELRSPHYDGPGVKKSKR